MKYVYLSCGETIEKTHKKNTDQDGAMALSWNIRVQLSIHSAGWQDGHDRLTRQPGVHLPLPFPT